MIISIVLQSCAAEDDGIRVSGELKGGLRIINLDDSLDVSVYRGDYIVLTSSLKQELLSIPSMNIEGYLPLTIDGKEYIKMKKTGAIDFLLGSRKGRIDVIDLTAPNYSEISSKEATEIIENISPLILDVRTEREFNSGHIEGATLIPVQVLSSRLGELDKYKEEPIFIYCRSGNRSTVAAKMLLDAGFTQIYNLRRGFTEWASEGYPWR